MLNPLLWAQSHNWQSLKSANGIKGQCVSVSSLWSEDNQWGRLDGQSALSISRIAPAGYRRIENTPDNYPIPGDIIFWDGSFGRGFGHTGLVLHADTQKVVVFQQNDPEGSAAHTKEYTYQGVICWFRHNDSETIVNDPALLTDNHNARVLAIRWLIYYITGNIHADDEIVKYHLHQDKNTIDALTIVENDFYASLERRNEIRNRVTAAHRQAVSDPNYEYPLSEVEKHMQTRTPMAKIERDALYDAIRVLRDSKGDQAAAQKLLEAKNKAKEIVDL